MNKQRYLEIEIKGYKWKVFCQTDSAFNRKHGSKVYHIVYPEDREIYFNKKYLTYTFAWHETAHAFVWSTDTEHSQSLTSDDVEDLVITVCSKNQFRIGQIAQDILDFFGGDK